ncbi:M23 family metallopeptidase [Paenibacillus sp. 481]|uniref:M23 family metallopeptidase n=1 Tax=Paenibacillus sp. 481 TaxID=2835869 RepID=UPI003FA6B7C0|nr:M23 family metallopeptidase [Paenibacillus sp. 481]
MSLLAAMLWCGQAITPASAYAWIAGGNKQALASNKALHVEPKSSEGDKDKSAFLWRDVRLLYEKISATTGIPWYRLAAIDQYERTLTRANPKHRAHPERKIGIYIEPPKWAGMLNPDWEDRNPRSISIFKGLGRDGSGDAKAEYNNDDDLLYSLAAYIGSFGLGEDDFGIGLWNYYHNPRAVQRIKQFARIYEHFDRLDLYGSAFPLPVSAVYSYRSTWGMGRHYGGFRIHEGTDIFAPHGVPVRSTSYGIVEIKGWNRYGGWRIGIRDLNNIYHYYAHLSGFEKNMKLGDIVVPGQPIGWVGSSGYGKPGTSGKFPPHLHFGVYRDRGLLEYAFDPYPLLRKWESSDIRQFKQEKKEREKAKQVKKSSPAS